MVRYRQRVDNAATPETAEAVLHALASRMASGVEPGSGRFVVSEGFVDGAGVPMVLRLVFDDADDGSGEQVLLTVVRWRPDVPAKRFRTGRRRVRRATGVVSSAV